MEVLKKTAIRALIGAAGLFFLLSFGNKLAHIIFPQKSSFKILIKDGMIKKGESLYSTLNKDFSNLETIMVCNSLGKIYNTRSVKPGEKYKIYYSTSGKVLKLIYMPTPFADYIVERSSAGFIAQKRIPDIEEKLVAVKGTIKNSLYESMVDSRIDVRTVMEFADIFQWQVDFFTEVMPGDKFLLVFVRYFRDGKAVKNGPIHTAVYKKKNISFSAIKFQDSKYHDYYDAKGNSLRKQFLRAPLNFTRISSYFAYRRMHPILKYARPHLGIDYAAPRGAPVSAIGSGRVIAVGRKGGLGKRVSIRHNAIYTTVYGHLNSYAKGIKKGARVKQDDVIGYVGSTGLATGPHLHFTIKKNGRPVNFFKLKFPSAKSVSKNNKEKFMIKVDQTRKYLKYLESDFFTGRPVLIEDFKKSREYVNIDQIEF